MRVSISPNMKPLRDVKTIEEGDKVYYELGRKINPNNVNYERNWIREGKFEEIRCVKHWLENDVFIGDKEYLEHHNFMIIKKGT